MPLIAGIILGGMSPSVWYGGDKIAALWMTFVGIVLLLLTGTFQVQAYIQSTILQPQLELLPPEKSSILTWRPPTDNSLNIRGENDQLPIGHWKVPNFSIKNSASVNAQDVSIKWTAARYDLSAVTANKPVFHGRRIDIGNDSFTLASPGAVPFTHPFSFSAVLEKPFITRTAETFIPLNVWNTAALYFLVSLPQKVGSRSDPYYFDLSIAWNIPENAKPARYRVKAVATRLGSADDDPPSVLSASIAFTVESVE